MHIRGLGTAFCVSVTLFSGACTPVDGVSPLYNSTLLPLDPGKISPDSGATAEEAQYNRNFNVGRYLTESDQLCADYLQSLTKVQRDYNLIFGSLSTLFGGLGAAFTHASVVRPLSAAAGIASAERAEIDADTFAKQTAQVIIAAIKNSRARTYNTIVQVNFKQSIQDWPISVALADVEDYHLRCSLHEGITEAAAAIGVASPQGVATSAATQTATPVGRSEGPPPQATSGSALGAAAGAATAASKAGASPAVVAAAAAGGGAGAVSGAANPAAAATAGATAGAQAASPGH